MENQFKGTKGNWRISNGNKNLITCNDVQILVIKDWQNNEDEFIANSQLIASAPELLEALENLLWQFEINVKGCQHHPSYQQAKAAITKAINTNQ